MEQSEKPWHSWTVQKVLDDLRSSSNGLSVSDAARRLSSHGPNELPATAGRPALLRFLAQFNNVLIYFLITAAVAAFVLGHAVDAAVIAAVVLVNAIVGFIQEGKAEKALNAIRSMIAPHALILRDGLRTKVAVRDLVPGDIVFLEAGDKVPADLRLVRARRLLIDEALLTGESVAAEKDEAIVPAEASLGDRRGMAFSGTLVAAGQATGVVVETGMNTQIGHISRLLQAVEPLSTPLLRQIDQFARRFTWVVLIGGALLFAFAVLVRGFEWVEALIAVVALAVGIVPEGLPAVITITLAIGVRRMAIRNAVIRKLPAVETLGATSVICTDKTGTLTRNEMTARRIVTQRHEVLAGGSGYAPEGKLTAAESSDDLAALGASGDVLRCGLLCNDAELELKDGRWIVNGDPMEGALIALAMKAGLNPAHARAEWPRLDEIPFDAAHRFMATLHAGPDGETVVFVKGAAEALFAMAPGSIDADFWNARIAAAGSEGERVLAFGMKRLVDKKERLDFADVADGVEFLGIVGFIDPPRPEVAEAIAQCRTAGIAVKMITGDHAATALAIARQLDLAEDPQAVTGAEIEALSDAELRKIVGRVSVFARTSPEHKLRIVRGLQANGLIVAMTGDGVNDAPSLRQADVGTAMGIKGTEASKEAAEMVLLDDNFASIVNAVSEGRTVYDNIRKVISWEIPTNGAETLAVVLAILVGFSLPMSATQILWVNLILASTLGLVLAFEPPEPGVMRRRPRSAKAPLLSPFLLWRVVVVSVLLAAAALGVFFYALNSGRDVETARTMVVNMFIVGEIFYLFNVRYLHLTSFSWQGVLGTPVVLAAIAVLVIAQLLFTYAPFMQALFETRPLTITDGVLIIAIGAGLMFLLELEKLLMRRLGWFEELKD
ncbi:HAD-IC family P-type ATPase [Microvirga guangxiensis]|uniref:ATPase, P-type (Transporting), HAD superfamily, subfamily IC n=1 Tax=Microvirga guangxiensis TaxID=549386 RepID=A0A1G5IXL9_9HYPH|nr:HAD-IC family P-type ATPase [Microvirga guangxiensis]SCY80833.1 ATPase, P-type (transporting), HAD superfamily, subfamily IC [Microvirga guangxiensis]